MNGPFDRNSFGLVLQPKMGTIDLVIRAKSADNASSSVQLQLSQLIKTKLKNEKIYTPTTWGGFKHYKVQNDYYNNNDSDSLSYSEEGGTDEADEIILGTDGEQIYFISRSALQTAIKHTEMGFGLTNDDKFFRNEEEKQKINEIQVKQRILLQNREYLVQGEQMQC